MFSIYMLGSFHFFDDCPFLFAEKTIFERSVGAVFFAAFLFFLALFYLASLYRNRSRTVQILIPIRKRSKVPWNLGDVFFIAVLFFIMPVVLYNLIPSPDFLIKGLTDLPVQEEVDLAKAHPISELMARAAGSPNAIPIFLLAFFTGVIAAPLTEEFLFRVVFQGALEKEILDPDDLTSDVDQEDDSTAVLSADRKCPDNNISTGRESAWNRKNFVSLLIRFIVVFLPAFLFAAIHARNPDEIREPEILLKGFCVIPISYFITVAFGIFWLMKKRNARWSDFGLMTGKIFNWKGVFGDFLRGMLGFVLMAPLVFGVLKLMNDLMPERVNDPGAIFILALSLGIFYLRSHSWITVFALHFCLNLTSFILVLLMLK